MIRHSLLAVVLLAAGTISAAAATPSANKSHQPEALSAGITGATTEWSARKRVRHLRRSHAVDQAYGAIGGIACTQNWCAPVPVGCRPVTGYDWRGYPRGDDAVACSYRY